MPRQAVFGLDWDGCAEIIKSYELYLKDMIELHESGHHNEYIDKIYQAKFKACHDVFINTIKDLAKHRITSEVTCASNRQSRYLDKILQQQFGGSGTNFSALDEIKAFAQEQHFIFNPILLADKIHNKIKGASFLDEKLSRSSNLNIGGMPNFEWDPSKSYMLSNQFEYYTRQGQDIDYFFIDDDHSTKIAESLITYFVKCPDALPDNIHFHMIKFDYQEIFDQNLKPEEINSAAYQLMQPLFSMSKNELGQVIIQEYPSLQQLLAPSPLEEAIQARIDWLVHFIDGYPITPFFNEKLAGFFTSIKRNIIFNDECNTLGKIQEAIKTAKPANLVMPKEFEIWYGELCFLSLCEGPDLIPTEHHTKGIA